MCLNNLYTITILKDSFTGMLLIRLYIIKNSEIEEVHYYEDEVYRHTFSYHWSPIAFEEQVENILIYLYNKITKLNGNIIVCV